MKMAKCFLNLFPHKHRELERKDALYSWGNYCCHLFNWRPLLIKGDSIFHQIFLHKTSPTTSTSFSGNLQSPPLRSQNLTWKGTKLGKIGGTPVNIWSLWATQFNLRSQIKKDAASLEVFKKRL